MSILAFYAFLLALGLAAYFRAEPHHLDALVTSALDGPLDDAMAAACAAESTRNSATPIFDGLAVEQLWAEMDAWGAER